MGQGRDQSVQYLKDNPALTEISKLVFEAHGLKMPAGSIKTPVAVEEKEVATKEKETAKAAATVKTKAGNALSRIVKPRIKRR